MKIAHISLADWHQSVAGWPLELEGFYWRLVRFMYARNGLEDSDADNARMMGLDPRAYRRLKAQLVALGVIEIRDGQLVNERVETELQRYEEHRERAAEGGRKGGIISGQNRALRAISHGTSARTSPELLPEVHPVPPTSCEQNQWLVEPTPTPTPSPTKKSSAVRGAAPPSNLDELEGKLLEACNGALANPCNSQGLLNLAIPQMWIDNGADLERDILPTLRAAGKKHHGKNISSWSYFSGMVAETVERRKAGLPPVQPAKPKKPSHLARY